MAIIKSENIKLKKNTPTALREGVAITSATDGCLVDYSGADDSKILITLENTGSSKASIKILKGNALQGAKDLVFDVLQNEKKGIVVESGMFVNAFGENKGYLHIMGDTGVKVSAIELD